MKMPRVDSSYFPLNGGLDLMTPAISLDPGMCFDAQNYETEISGGYRRIDGFERFDGHAAPSSANYWIMVIHQTGAIAVSDTLTGVTSGATAKVLAIVGSTIVLGRLVGTFVAAENLTDGGAVGTVTSVALVNSAPKPSDDADYALLAANDLRTSIAKVPGSGQIRGVWVYKDVVYAFRDNAGATAGAMYKQTAGGWSLVSFGTEIQFTNGLAAGPIVAGNTIIGGTSAATALVVTVMERTGSWSAGTMAGTLIISTVTGTWQNAESIKVGATPMATSASLATAIARAPGGAMEFNNFNFTGSTATHKMYGCDGVNLAFEFDGTNYIPIRTGMAVDTPSHLIGYKTHLVMSFKGSIQLSAIGAPYTWTTILGAAEIATGDYVTGFLPQGGTSAGSALAIFTSGRTFTLYGSVIADFKLVNSIGEIGYSPFTMQNVSNNAYGMTARGIQSMITTLTYGDFDYSSISHNVQTLINSKRGLETASTTLHAKNQYRVYFSDGTGLAVGLTGDKVSGILPLNYGIPVRCMCTATLTTGAEVTYFGSDDGYVYQDNIGTSFDGLPIEHWIRLPFNHEKSPRERKRFRRAVLEVKVVSYTKLNVSYDLGYGNPAVQPSAAVADTAITGGGGYWDQFTWDQFTWDAAVVNTPSISLNGTEKNISLLFYGSRAQDKSHTLQGVNIAFSSRRTER